MRRFKWAYCAVLGTWLAVLCLVVRAQQAEDVFGPPAKAGQAAAERSVLAGTVEPDEAADFCRCAGESDSEAVRRIEQVLKAPLRSAGLEFQEPPLEEVANLLSSDYGIPILLDTPALDEIGLAPDEPVTISLHNITLRSALRIMLKQVGLTFIIRDEVLLITTPEEAERDLVTCVYDVSGLVDEKDPQSMKSLTDTLMSCVARETWSSKGGGAADVTPLKPGLLVVSQARVVQEEIEGLLAVIRKMREQVPVTKGKPREPQPAQ